jgi:hypothetical protein
MSEDNPPPSGESPTRDEAEAFTNEHLVEYHTYIGRIASVWAMLEFHIDRVLWEFMKVEQTTGACVTTQMNGTTPRLRAMKALMELRGSSAVLLTKLNKFTADLNSPQEDRNRIVHDPWFVGSVTKRASQIRKAVISNRIVYERVTVDITELEKIYKDSIAILRRFAALRDEILAEPESSLRERRRTRLWRAGLRGGAISDQDSGH